MRNRILLAAVVPVVIAEVAYRLWLRRHADFAYVPNWGLTDRRTMP